MAEEKPISQEQPEEAIETPAPSTPEAASSEPQQPSRANLILSRILRWAVGLGIVLALGIALTWFVQVQPRAQRIQELETELASANQQITELQDEVNELLPIRDQRNRAELHLSLLNVLVDVSTAQMAIAQNDPENAAAALAETDLKLINLRSNVDADQAGIIEELRERLILVQEGINSDTFAAQSDLEVMRNSLLDLEESLFGE